MRHLRAAPAPLLAVLALAACAHAVTVAGMLPPVDPQAYRPTNRSIRIDSVTGGKETHGLGTSNIGNAQLADALVQSLTASRLFTAVDTSGPADWSLAAQILNQETTSGFTMRSTLFVHYSVRDAASGSEVLSRSILSQAEAGLKDAAYGPTRFRIVKERAVRDNLSQLLQLLSDSLPHGS